MTINCPVTFIIYNRPEKTQLVFNQIEKVKPKKLYVVADGPKHPEDEIKCRQCRSIIDNVSWDCVVERNYSTTNLGCKKRVSSGLDWVFSHCDRSIILEDDCLPDLSFFRYCEELLTYYEDDQRVMVISGNNFHGNNSTLLSDYSYYFSVFNHNWGWATWRRAWRFYDLDMKLWPVVRNTNWLFDILPSKRAIKYWKSHFDLVFNNKLDTWDYQWTFANWINHGLTVIPKRNLVRNIGFGKDATHTMEKNNPLDKLSSYPMEFPISHPPYLIRNWEADLYSCKLYDSPNLPQMIFFKALFLLRQVILRGHMG